MDKNTKKNLIIAIIVSIIVFGVLTIKDFMVAPPKDTVIETLESWKKQDEDTFKEMLVDDKIDMSYKLIQTSKDDNPDLIELSQKLESKIYKDMQYKVITETIKDDDHATVTIQIKTIDTNSFLNNFIAKITDFYYQSKSVNGTLKEEQFYEEINDSFEESIQYKNFKVDVKLKKVQNHWKITNAKTLINALTGGYLDYQYHN